MDIEDDVLQVARELAKRDGTTAGRVLSTLARKGLALGSGKRSSVRGGVPLLPSRGEIITLEKIQQLRDSEGV